MHDVQLDELLLRDARFDEPFPHAHKKKNIIVDAHLFHPRFDAQNRQPFHFQTIHDYQQDDAALRALAIREPFYLLLSNVKPR
jgi:hypothetical protein